MGAKKAKGKKEWKLYVRIALVFTGILLATASWKIYEDVLASNINLPRDKSGYLYIHTGYTFSENLDKIRETKLLRDVNAFSRLARIFRYESRLKPGRYKVSGSTSNLELLRMLASGKQEAFDVTFRYAERKTDLAGFWSNQLEADSATLLALLNNEPLLDSLDLDTATSVSLFIPNTYNFYWNTSAEKLFRKMISEYRHFWDGHRQDLAAQLGLTPAQVITLASIVQKETYRKDEMPVVAGVYYNRLQKGMYLGADPTVIYAMNDKSIRRVWGAMLDVESPYNTYRHTGLPPGPICVPSIQAVDAVLNMSRHKYLYFCAREDLSGYHNFAETYAQHQQNARRYQRMLNSRGIR